MITVVNYGMGNLGSILNMLKKIGVPGRISSDREEIASAAKLILPGVGAFDTAMRNLAQTGLGEILTDLVMQRGVPVLGLCLGMQLLTERSEEGVLPGLGWIKGDTRRFRFEGEASSLKVPHMGWNTVRPDRTKPLVASLYDPSRFYFVHSYHVQLDDPADAAAWTHYGYEFVSIIQRGHIMGTQFHPEKSHKFGMRLLQTFAELPC